MKKIMHNLLVTAANSDIGSAVVQRFSMTRECSRLLITTHESEDRLDGLPEAVVHLRKIDLTKEHGVKQVAEECRRVFDTQFCWLHCAGDFWHHRSIENTSFDDAQAMITSHYFTLYATARYVLPVMKSLSGGRVLAFSCNSVRYNYPDMAAFTPAKAAVESLVKCLANEMLQHNIFLNCLALPTIATPKVLATKVDEYHSYYVSVEALVDAIFECFTSMSPLVTGNAIGLVKYSPSFHRDGYYTRNRQKENPTTLSSATS